MSKTSILLSGRSLTLARKLSRLQDEARKEQRELREEYQRQAEASQAAYSEALRTQFANLLQQQGIPATEIEVWSLDIQYLKDHNVAILEKVDIETPKGIRLN